jgi:hypothetical protein
MKSISVFLSTFLISFNCFSQSLEGEWKGSFTSFNAGGSIDGVSTTNNCWPMGGFVDLKFMLNKDGSYTVYSLYKGIDTMNVCGVLYKRINNDLVYLEETKIIKPEYVQGSRAFMKMDLKIKQRKKSIQLMGTFSFISGGFCKTIMPGLYYGDISFYKKTREKVR